MMLAKGHQMMLMVVRAHSCKHFLKPRLLQVSSYNLHSNSTYNEDLCGEKQLKRNSSYRIHSNIVNQCVLSRSNVNVVNITRHLRISSGSTFVSKRSYSSEAPRTAYETILASEPVHFAQSVLEYGHSITGLPWWASIVLTTFMLRAVMTFPLSVYSQHIRARIENLQPEMVQNAKRIFQQRYAAQAKQEKWDEKRMKKVISRMMQMSAKQLYVRHNCHPAKGSIMLLVQIPLWICISLSLRNMTGAISSNFFLDPVYVVPALADGGALWFSNLVLPDPFYVLPVAVGVLNLLNIELQTLTGREGTRFQRFFTNLLRGLSVVMIPIAAYLPSAISLYWMTSAGYSLIQNLFLKLPTVRHTMRIPPSGSDTNTPFQDMKRILKLRYSRKNDKNTARK